MDKKLSRRASLKLATSAAALGAGLGVDLIATQVSAAPGSAVQFKLEIEGVTAGVITLDEKGTEMLRKYGARRLTFSALGGGERGKTLGAFRLPAAVQIKIDEFLKEG